MSNKIGVGIITCNRPEYLKGLLSSLIPCKDSIGELAIVNDGDSGFDVSTLGEAWVENSAVSDMSGVPGTKTIFRKNVVWLQNETNLGVAKSKNKALKHLAKQNCDYFFLIEDDMLIKDSTVFRQYIKAHEVTGIHHFNYGPGSPFNRKQKIKDYDLHNRHLLDESSEPNPKLIISYGSDVNIALYEHTVAMFSFFTKEVLQKVGGFPEEYDRCWEHVDHTFQIIKAGYHPPFWWFADVANSHELLSEAPGAIDNSAIAKDKDDWMKRVMEGREIFKTKYGHYPNFTPLLPKEPVVEYLKRVKP